MEVYDDPSSIQPPPVPYQQTPQVFLFSRPATAHLDQDTATALAWKIRGQALTLLVHRCASYLISVRLCTISDWCYFSCKTVTNSPKRSHTDVYFCFIRENPAVKTLEKYNVAYRLPKKVECHLYRELMVYFSLCLILGYPLDVFLKSSEVKYVTLQDLDEVLELLERQEEEEPEVEEEPEAGDLFVDTSHCTCLM